MVLIDAIISRRSSQVLLAERSSSSRISEFSSYLLNRKERKNPNRVRGGRRFIKKIREYIATLIPSSISLFQQEEEKKRSLRRRLIEISANSNKTA